MPAETQVHYNKQFLQEELRQLASLQQVTLDAKPLEPIDDLLEESRKTLVETYRVLARAAKKNRELSSAAEWLIDNFYIVQEQMVQLKEDLPPSYYKKLPRLLQGEYRGFPRTYEIIQMLASISDNIIDRDNTATAIRAYQEVDTLSIGEMWSVPLMNRLALVVRLADRSKQLLKDRRIQDEAEQVLQQHKIEESDEPGFLLRKLSEIMEQKRDTSNFLVVLAQRLQSRGVLTETERRWFDYKFSRWDTNLEEQLRVRTQQTSRLHLSIQNAIASLREVSETDWSGFVEECSVVERILRLDPADMYSRMDFSTRDSYRKKVEQLSLNSEYSEQEVAEQVLMMAESAAQNGTVQSFKKMHVGYYLLDDGYQTLCKKLNYKKPLKERLLKLGEKYPGVYFSFITIHLIVLLLIVSLFTNLLSHQGWVIAITLLAAFLPALDLSIVSTNRILSFLIPPRILPKLEFKSKIPHEYRTTIVVPTIFSSPEDVEEQFELLEIRALANANPSLQFALLSDFPDAPQEKMDSDDAIMETAYRQLERLNERYNSIYGNKFMLFHRKRLWNESEEKWMGWERKRGKIEEFNRLLKNPSAETTYYEDNEQFLQSLQERPVKFVITLDADTKLPPGSAKKLIGTAAHPLNRAEIDESGNFVKKGYGIFQPRISIPPKAANKTWFARIYSGNVGLDPYTTAVSDIYQDLFGEGVYTGKGLYDVDAFQTVLDEHFPENAILSHDLLESTYLRSALLTDIELFDEFPTTYLNYAKRNHRWIRGDWQILYWLFSRVPAPNGQMQKNPINSVSKWKIFDNLRRSLNPVALITFLLLGWTVLPGSALIWTAAVFGIVAFPIYSSFSTDIFRRPARVGWKLYLEKIRADMKMNTIQSVTSFLFLPHQAVVSTDAIIRSLYRMFISGKKLLEWTTAIQIERRNSSTLAAGYWKKMWFNVFWALFCLVIVAIYKVPVLIIAIPICIGWILTPALAFLLEREPVEKEKELKFQHIKELRNYARRTWHYFEMYMNEDQSWLPPDNVQEEPYVGVVGRTSPTNMGLSLLSVYTAYELGYITLSKMLELLDNTLSSMLNLERYHGHFYNWYSNKLGEVLNPNYVSTVDSGNLAASLIVIQQALDQLPHKQWPDPVFWRGLRDTIDVIDEMLIELGETRNQEKLYQILSRKLEGIRDKFPGKIPDDLAGWYSSLNMLHQPAKDLMSVNLTFLREEFEDLKYSEWKDWLSRPFIQVNDQLTEIEEYFSNNGQDRIVSGMKNPEKHLLKFNKPFAAKLGKAQSIADICRQIVGEMDFKLLYNEERDLFSIGFNAGHAAQDKGTYDLLASEARLASFIAIAKGDVPPEHWFKLSRRLTSIDRNEILLSWSGTMFEYLMPLLFMARYDKTLLSNTYDHVVDWQKNYGHIRRQPWGFSESGYNILNLELQYQYRAFGVPGLGLRRGLAEDYVVAPYASMLALMVDPVDSLKNLQTIKKEGAYSTNGFYEALDYTPGRNDNNGGNEKAIVKMYMAHHQGMSLLAMANVLDRNMIQNLFHNHPLVQSCELLLQERIPRGIPVKEPRPIDVELEPAEEEKAKMYVDHAGIDDINDLPPRTHILSNGRYSTLVTHTGTGYSSFEDTMLTRWRPDVVRDAQGFFFYLRDVESNEFWSVGHQPVGRKPDRYDSWYHAGKVQMARVDDWIESFMEVCVSPEDDIELRKITLTNYSEQPREIEVTSYAETVLNTQEADMAHPAFSNLFVQTEYVREHHAILAKRRPRKKDEEPIWLVHTIASEDIEESQELQIESDRKKFIGRNRTLKDPAALDPGAQLSGSVGNVPDPIVSIRRTVTLQPGQKKNITFGLGRTKSREEAITMADRYDNPYATDRVFELASIYGQVELEHIGLSGEQSHYFQKLAGYLLFNCEEFQASEDILKRNRRTQSGLWVHGISGDVPILVYQIADTKYIREVGLLLKAHMLWRLKGLKVDLVFINDHPPSYVDELQEAIHQQIQLSTERQRYREKGGVFVLRSDELSPDDRTLIETVAQVVLKGKLPNVRVMGVSMPDPDQTDIKQQYRPVELTENESNDNSDHSDLLFFNGYGGFTRSGKEYVIKVSSDKDSDKLNHPPAPWMNMITNSEFGFITTENGSDHTWSKNSRENKLTPWSNDTVTDPTGEALYIRDEENGLFWSPTPGPIPGASNYEVRHGFGYTIFSSRILNIDQQVTKWVAKDDPIKIIKLSLSNADLMPKKISLFRYLDWVLGVFREETTRHVITHFDKGLQTIFARNYYNNEFAGRVAFAGLFTGDSVLKESYTGDRAEFIGRNRELNNPRILYRKESLDERFGVGFESCAASEQTINLDSGESRDFYYFLGETASEEEARQLIRKYRDSEVIEDSLTEVRAFWDEKLTRIRVDTPVPEYDLLVNGWLQYQNIACRMWGRTGFYQSGGAFGFRDQLQDATAACYLDPDLSRKQILLHAAHQFPEGDVLHWWHPPTDRGIRSRISDDLLWLPYVTAFYVNHTGDRSILQEPAPFVTARQLQEQEHEAYMHPQTTEETVSLYEHCCRAIDRSLTTGAHGLPLIGSGDWNDGMNNVGEQGKGESVWLGFFLYDILGSFIPICKKQDDRDRVRKYKDYQKNLKTHLNKEGWDGEWYRRAFYDDGTPLGSSQNRECKIDAIAQAWSIISGAAPPQKAQKALESADKFLVSEQEGIIRLLTPAFDQTPKDPGYIKGYIPGVRENGGQYTHAALWLVKAMSEFGNRERAAHLLQMLTPINHSRNTRNANLYSVEPYAVAADIYGEPPLTGMGGWTWYTGSAGWMYRVMLESILGVTIEKGNTLCINPFISPNWKRYSVNVRERVKNGEYNISISNPQRLSDGRLQVMVDGRDHPPKDGIVKIRMKKDGEPHKVEIVVEKS